MSGDRSHGRLQAQLDDILTCVHCGFCLPACPTYEVLGDENDSPRGRIYLMRAVAEGRLDPSDESFALHMDRCVGCRACEPVCPSGVRYGFLLEHAREARRAAGGIRDHFARLAIQVVFSSRTLQTVIWLLSRVLRLTRLPALIARIGGRTGPASRFRFALAMLAATAPTRWRGKAEAASGDRARSAVGATESDRNGDALASSVSNVSYAATRESDWVTVAHLEGCVMWGLFRHVNRATARVIQAHGGEPKRLPAGLCCGALHAHAGELESARQRARRLISAFRNTGAEVLLTNSAGCAAALKEYGEWLEHDTVYREPARDLARRAQELTEWLVRREGPAYSPIVAKVGYDAPCHLLHGQGIADAPLEVLRRVPGLEVVPLPRSDRCCGAAGTYGLLQRHLAADILKRKLAEVDEADVFVVATGNPGCLMQIGAGARTHRRDLRVVHPVEILHSAIPRDAF